MWKLRFDSTHRPIVVVVTVPGPITAWYIVTVARPSSSTTHTKEHPLQFQEVVPIS